MEVIKLPSWIKGSPGTGSCHQSICWLLWVKEKYNSFWFAPSPLFELPPGNEGLLQSAHCPLREA